MNQSNSHQEVLLLTGSSFANRELRSSQDGIKEENFFSAHEKLEKACWDGMLDEMLPELAADDSKNERFIWQILSADNFLCINVGMSGKPVESETSIDPYCFITYVNPN